jgi:hypothetical protein
MHTPGIMLSTEFWFLWGRNAIREAKRAEAARKRWSSIQDSGKQSTGRDAELDAALIAICAAGFSIESLVLVIADKVMPAVAAKWREPGRATPFASRLNETLKHALAMPGREVEDLVEGFEPVINKRSAAVHHFSQMEAPVAHPLGGLTSRASTTYSTEEASIAVTAMGAIYQSLLTSPKPAAVDWVTLQRRGIKKLSQQ